MKFFVAVGMEKETLSAKEEEHVPCGASEAQPTAGGHAVNGIISAGRRRVSDGSIKNVGAAAEKDIREQMVSKSSSVESPRPKGQSKSQDSVLNSSSRTRSFGPSPAMQYGILSPEHAGTPNSVSQLFNLPSSTFSLLDGLELPSPSGSGIISPLTSAYKLGRKRAISISPLSSSSQLDFNNLIRSSSSSLANCIPASSRENSAGSIGHLSPSLFVNPSMFAGPHRAPPFSLRNAAHPPPPPPASSHSFGPTSHGSSHQSDSVHATHTGFNFTIKEEPLEDSSASQPTRNDGGPMLQFTANSQESGFNSQPRGELETLHEEEVASDDEMQTDPSNSGNYSSAFTEDGEPEDSKDGILDNRPRRVSRVCGRYDVEEAPWNVSLSN